ncbi:trans-sulfuration enzyme family protein [Paenibacillus sp. URB8-2]|uniref:trans-sulfuration enzyme family protein n=1 Tax=Paenibacillus sp. URB8-2 TaxID=2741301 RepID=UPI0015B81EBE|nr:aminotransferase class I/II-fold pyridoxal phosphate-dependent enzyme [Paenibacillus sp. URB8-2]BCG58791.1 cystathionine gamma-synthase [Paenibacillus sp. URB8-2]
MTVHTEDELHEETLLLHSGEDKSNFYYNAVVPPIFQTSLFSSGTYEEFRDAINHENGSYCYTRYGNPNFDIVCDKIASLEQGDGAVLTSSGVSALTIAIMANAEIGMHVVAIDNLYGPTRSFLEHLKEVLRIQVTYVSGESLEEIEAAMTSATRLVVLESPVSTTFGVQDLRGIAALCKPRGIVTLIDNSYSTPLLQKPLNLGIDIVVHSATKFLSGHSDTIGGVIVSREPHLKRIRKQHKLIGSSPSPFEAWLILRGLRTLPIRMKEHARNALAVAEFLESHPKIGRVRYPALQSFPQYELARSQMSGFAGLFSFEINTAKENMPQFFNALHLIKLGLSWGGFESICVPPLVSFGKGIDEEAFAKRGITHQLVRLHVGLENPDDLIHELDRALKEV